MLADLPYCTIWYKTWYILAFLIGIKGFSPYEPFWLVLRGVGFLTVWTFLIDIKGGRVSHHTCMYVHASLCNIYIFSNHEIVYILLSEIYNIIYATWFPCITCTCTWIWLERLAWQCWFLCSVYASCYHGYSNTVRSWWINRTCVLYYKYLLQIFGKVEKGDFTIEYCWVYIYM